MAKEGSRGQVPMWIMFLILYRWQRKAREYIFFKKIAPVDVGSRLVWGQETCHI